MKTVQYSLIVGALLASLTGCCNNSSNTGNSELEAFNTECMPFGYSSSGFGDIAFDSDGNLLLTGGYDGNVSLVNRQTCTLSNITQIPDTILSVVDYPGNDTLYAGGDSGIYEVDRDTGTFNKVVNDSIINAMVVAPQGYGAYGGDIIFIAYNEVYAYDPASANPPELIVSLPQVVSDLVFGGDGTLYIADYNQGKIITLASNGTATDFVTGLGGVDGLTVDTQSGTLFAACSSPDRLYSIDIASKTKTELSTINFDGGYYPSGIVFDGFETLIMKTGENPGFIESFSLVP